MKKLLIIAISIILVVMIAIPIMIHKVAKITHERIYEVNWKIDVPSDFIEKYNYSSERGFQGDGDRYTIFETNNMGVSIIKSMHKIEGTEIYTGTSTSNKDELIEQFVLSIAAELNVPENNKPFFDEEYLWKRLVKNHFDELVILYFPNTNQVIFVERLI